MREHGITDLTETVHTRSYWAVVSEIGRRKARALLDGVEPSGDVLVVGLYLTGVFLVKELVDRTGVYVTVYDEEVSLRELLRLLNLDVYMTHIPPSGAFDFVIDLTGLGGVEPEVLRSFEPDVIVVENPLGNVRDPKIADVDDTEERLSVAPEAYELRLGSCPFDAKTSGTMTLSVGAVREAARRVEEVDGVLYAVPNVVNLERYIFVRGRPEVAIEEAVTTPALTVSQIKGSADPDAVLGEVLDEIDFEVRCRG